MSPSLQKFLSSLEPAAIEVMKSRLQAPPEQWSLDEIGDGNVNLIYKVKSQNASVLVKQAVPYLRCVGEAWPLSMRRNFFEYKALIAHGEFVGNLLPKVYHYDDARSYMVMEFLEDHIILRKGLMQGFTYPALAEHLSDYMANTLFHTSDLFLTAAEKRAKMAVFLENGDLCKITEDLIFTDPYRLAKENRWTSPSLDFMALRFRTNPRLKLAISELKHGFLTRAEALLHGDLHSGSIMVNDRSTKIIDPEFAVYGPIGFDVGMLLANFIMSYFSQFAFGKDETSRAKQEAWLLEQLTRIWSLFIEKFTGLWNTHLKGDLIPARLLEDKQTAREVIDSAKSYFVNQIYSDTLGYAGAELARRNLGLAHVQDFDSIQDPEIRSLGEFRSLIVAEELLLNRAAYSKMEQVIELLKQVRVLAMGRTLGQRANP